MPTLRGFVSPVTPFAFDDEIGGQTIKSIRLEHGSPLNSREESPRRDHELFGWMIEMPAVMDLLDLIEAGEATPGDVATMLREAAKMAAGRLEEGASPSVPAIPPPTPQPERPTYVYVIAYEGTDRIKIGISKNVSARLRELQLSSPYKLTVRWQGIGSWEIEQRLHTRFREYHSHSEWFDFTGHPDPVSAIRRAAIRMGAKEVVL
ncbi:GIY-YIG nuclease family protein [Saccharomonospora azurea]|uniref:GIY-YIG nuclease family protein n=1 Tax=Saccharomonospora azurea TaxID=40988 RepID=UPI0033261DCC